MYYNSSAAAFRCYQDGFWRDCIADSPRSSYHVYNDLNGSVGGGNDQLDIQIYVNGAGAGSATLTGTAGHPGILQNNVDTSTTPDLSAIQVASQNDDVILLGNGDTWRYETVLRVPTLSDGTNTFIVRSGFLDTYAAADGGDGCYFKYSHNINAGEW